jgi:hypothetical protein
MEYENIMWSSESYMKIVWLLKQMSQMPLMSVWSNC